MKTLFVSVGALLMWGCGGEVPAESAEPVSAPDTLVITVTDTVGVLMGDTLLEFGNITDASLTPGNELYILDGLKGRLGIYTHSGEFIRFHGRPGSGPAEYQYPKSFALLEDGGLAISDLGAIAVTFLNPGLEYDTLITAYPVDRITPFPGGFFVGMSLLHGLENGQPTGETFLARFGRSPEPVHVYRSYPVRFTVDPDGDLNVHTVGITWDTSPDGSVALAQTCDSIWAFTAFDPSGEELFTVERDWIRVPKSEEELMEGAYHESLSTSTESGNSMNRDRIYDNQPLYRDAIVSVDIDDRNRIWVGQGWTDHPVFEVYDLTGELLFVASIPGLDGTGCFSYCFDNGFIAFDSEPEDYPKVYLLDVPL